MNKLKKLSYVYALLLASDFVSTVIGLKIGLTEVNPLFYMVGSRGFMYFKVFSSLICLAISYFHDFEYKQQHTTSMLLITLILCISIMSLIVMSNVFVIITFLY